MSFYPFYGNSHFFRHQQLMPPTFGPPHLAAVATLVATAPAPGDAVVVATVAVAGTAVAAPPSRLCSLEPGLLQDGKLQNVGMLQMLMSYRK